jgi:hypothetical protein
LDIAGALGHEGDTAKYVATQRTHGFDAISEVRVKAHSCAWNHTRRIDMKKLLLALVIPVVLLTGSFAQAAAPGPNANGDAAATTLPIAAADATRLKTWITDQ